MSGGTFDYAQYRINDIVEQIEEVVEHNRVPIPYKQLSYWQLEEYNKNNPPVYYDYDDETIELFKIGIHKLKEAQIYAQRIDWLLADDDGEDSFKSRLKEELEQLNKEQNDN